MSGRNINILVNVAHKTSAYAEKVKDIINPYY